jgi:hypothetical protein
MASAASTSSAAGTILATRPHAFGLGGIDRAAGEDQLHRPTPADRARQALRSAHPGNDAELDLGLAELGRIGGDDEVGHHRQLAPAAKRIAVDRRDPRLAHRPHDMALPAGKGVLAVEIRERLGR